jgi:hypothetical protein
VVNIAYESNKASTIAAANEALSKLKVDSSNQQALARLKTLSPELHDVFLYSKAIADKDMKMLQELKSSKAELIGDLATYESAKNNSDLNAYALKQDAIYKELSQIRRAVVLINDGNTKKAHEILHLINENSSLSKVAKLLLHYGVK